MRSYTFKEINMRSYTFKVLLPHGVIEVTVTASGIAAAENAVKSMYPQGKILTHN